MKDIPNRAASSSDFISRTLASGGDRRIMVARGSDTNAYGASPFPRSTLGYAASTANDISLKAFMHLEQMVESWPAGGLLDHESYRRNLELYRNRIRRLFGLGDGIEVVFAPSGTDLEFVALALASARAGGPVGNVLLGKDEVGSGCLLAAAGQYFASETVLRPSTNRGEGLAGLGDGAVIEFDVRTPDGVALNCRQICAAMDMAVERSVSEGLHPLMHVLHGSKTGLVLPGLAGMDALSSKYGAQISWVVDACQLRLEASDIRAYLERDAVVMLTGSKFAGGPPFSGFALVPASWRPSGPIAAGLATVFRRAEWPIGWNCCDHLPEGANPGLLLRLEAALFEIERFSLLAASDVKRVTSAFCGAVGGLVQRLGARMVTQRTLGGGLHETTLATIDLSPLPGSPDIEMAKRWHRVLAARGLRLGQPVRCLRRADGNWAGSLRISLSMPLIADLSMLDDERLDRRLGRDMTKIAEVIEAAQRPVVA